MLCFTKVPSHVFGCMENCRLRECRVISGDSRAFQTMKAYVHHLIVPWAVEILIVAIGLLVVVQVVFGSDGGIDIIGNITGVVDSFIGTGASLASLVALLIVMAVLGKKS